MLCLEFDLDWDRLRERWGFGEFVLEWSSESPCVSSSSSAEPCSESDSSFLPEFYIALVHNPNLTGQIEDLLKVWEAWKSCNYWLMFARA